MRHKDPGSSITGRSGCSTGNFHPSLEIVGRDGPAGGLFGSIHALLKDNSKLGIAWYTW